MTYEVLGYDWKQQLFLPWFLMQQVPNHVYLTNDAQRGQGELNSDYQHERTLTSSNHSDHNLTTALGNPLNKYLSQHVLNNDSTIIELYISGHTRLLRILGYYSAHPEKG